MSVVINTNVDSIKVQSILSGATSKLSQSMQRMSTGLKVLSAKDDAAGCVIATKMNTQLGGNKIAQNNVQSASALLSTAEGHLDVVQENLSRIRDLTLQARNGTYSETEKQAMQDEVAERIAEINRISDSSKYSTLKLFGDATGLAKDDVTTGTGEDAVTTLGGAVFQVGANAEDNDRIQAKSDLFKSVKFIDLIKNVDTNDGGLQDTDFENFYNQVNNIAAEAEAEEAEEAEEPEEEPEEGEEEASSITDDQKIQGFNIAKLSAGYLDKAIKALDKGLSNLTNRKSIIGSAQNRLASALDTLTTQYENLSSAKSIITDADIASEASNFTQQSILQQVSTSLLAQANQAPSIALSLI